MQSRLPSASLDLVGREAGSTTDDSKRLIEQAEPRLGFNRDRNRHCQHGWCLLNEGWRNSHQAVHLKAFYETPSMGSWNCRNHALSKLAAPAAAKIFETVWRDRPCWRTVYTQPLQRNTQSKMCTMCYQILYEETKLLEPTVTDLELIHSCQHYCVHLKRTWHSSFLQIEDSTWRLSETTHCSKITAVCFLLACWLAGWLLGLLAGLLHTDWPPTTWYFQKHNSAFWEDLHYCKGFSRAS